MYFKYDVLLKIYIILLIFLYGYWITCTKRNQITNILFIIIIKMILYFEK